MKFAKCIVVLAILIISPVLFTGCFGGGDPDYRVEFTLDGTDYSYTEAYNSSRSVAEGCKDDDCTKTIIVGKSADSNNDAYLYIPGITTGTFHDLAGSSIFFLSLGDGFRDHSETPDDFTVTITEYGDVGGLIRGTFSGTVEDDAETEYPVTDGYFEVIRRADGEIDLEN